VRFNSLAPTKIRWIRFLFLPLLLAALACQTFWGTSEPSPTIADESRLGIISPTLNSLITQSPTLAPTTTTSQSPSATWTLTPTTIFGDKALQKRVFEDLWQAIHVDYLYPDYNGLDWTAVHPEYLSLIESGLSDDDFYSKMEDLIFRLADEHSIFLRPEAAQEEDSEFFGESNYIGIGVLTSLVPERNRLVIIVVFPNSPAEIAGLQTHDSILAVNGVPVVDDNGSQQDLLRGPEGTRIELTIQSPEQEPRFVQITRSRVTGSIPVPSAQITSPGGKRVGYILLPTFSEDLIDEKMKEALRSLLEGNTLQGLVLDVRQNAGGADTVVRNILSLFTRGRLGYYVDRANKKRAFAVGAKDLQGSSKIPIVVLIGPNTASFGEIFAGVLKEKGRAHLIGEPTEGNIEILWAYQFEDGSRAWIARETFRPANNPEENWELTGIIPSQIVPSNWDEFTLETDPALVAALEYFDDLD